ncbi:MAG: hypothetical protein P4L53_17605 [Candidatus Obscuribacterales bacterium]|nr:hypothetical protein [Candidatus Obscuribacterales bacterium]
MGQSKNGGVVESHPNFGSWNDDSLMKYSQTEQKWTEIDPALQLQNITRLMKFFGDSCYSKQNADVIDMDGVQSDEKQKGILQNKLVAALYQ